MSCVCSCNFCVSVMAKYYKEISQLLALGEDSFEDELRRIVTLLVFGSKSDS